MARYLSTVKFTNHNHNASSTLVSYVAHCQCSFSLLTLGPSPTWIVTKKDSHFDKYSWNSLTNIHFIHGIRPSPSALLVSHLDRHQEWIAILHILIYCKTFMAYILPLPVDILSPLIFSPCRYSLPVNIFSPLIFSLPVDIPYALISDFPTLLLRHHCLVTNLEQRLTLMENSIADTNRFS